MQKIKTIALIGAWVLGISWFLFSTAKATDPPHNVIGCTDCHLTHNSLGPALTKDTNANLCLSCHVIGGPAENKPLASSMQANPAAGTGISHNWSGPMPAADLPDNAYGLRSTGSIANETLKTQLQLFNNTLACSVCHDQHSQANNPWDPAAPAYGGAGTGNGRHFQVMTNEANQLCEDCHAYRAMTRARVAGEDAAYPANGTNVFSHPVGEVLNSTGKDKTIPLDYNGRAQKTAPRYAGNSDEETPANSTNNLVLDAESKVRCLTCHRVHYTDANGLTVDTP